MFDDLQEFFTQVLLRCLAPFFDGISLRKLKYGLVRGELVLEDLVLKPELLGIFGIEGFRMTRSSVDYIELKMPWSCLYTGKVSLVVRGVNLELEQVSDTGLSQTELILEIRAAKRKAIELLAVQLQEAALRRHHAANAEPGNGMESFGINIARKFLNNLTVGITNVAVSMVSSNLGLAGSVELKNLAILSCNSQFRRCDEKEVLAVPGSAIYKLLALEGFGVRLSCTGAKGLHDAKYIAKEIGADIRFAHIPDEQRVHLAVELGTNGVNEVELKRSQLETLMGIQATIHAEEVRLQSLLVPPYMTSVILAAEHASAVEYRRLYIRCLLQENSMIKEGEKVLDNEEAERLQLLRDVLPVQLLAEQHRLANVALEEERARKQSGCTDMLWHIFGLNACAHCQRHAEEIQPDDLSMLLDIAESENVQIPSNASFHLYCRAMTLQLADDLHEEYEESDDTQLLSLAVRETRVFALATAAYDHRGQNSAHIKLSCKFGALTGMHAGQTIISPYVEGQSGTAATLFIENKLDSDEHLLLVSFGLAPIDIHLPPKLLPQLLCFFESAKVAAVTVSEVSFLDRQLDPEMQKILAQAAETVYDRGPDKIKVDIQIAATTLHLPVPDLGTVIVSLGQVNLHTPEACEMTGVDMKIDISDTVLRTVGCSGDRFDVLKPTSVRVQVQTQEVKDKIIVKAGVSTKELSFSLSPEALQTIMCAQSNLIVRCDTENDILARSLSTDSVGRTIKEAEQLFGKMLLNGTEEVASARLARRTEQLSNKVLQIELCAGCEVVNATISDSVQPVLRLRAEMPSPCLKLGCNKQSQLLSANATVTVMSVMADVRSARHGSWEPLLEPFQLGLNLTLEENDQANQVHAIVNSQTSLLINLSPSMINSIGSMVPRFVASLQPTSLEVQKTGCAVASKYRAVNLCGMPIEVELVSSSKSDLQHLVLPCSSDWVSLDDLILPHDVLSLSVRTINGGKSDALFLDQSAAVMVPGVNIAAELRTPAPSHRLLVIANPVQVHNQTDLPLFVRFHDAKGKFVETSSAMVCDGVVLGHQMTHPLVRSRDEHDHDVVDQKQCVVELPPNAVCSMPHTATRYSFKPTNLNGDFCKANDINIGSRVLSCYGKTGPLPTLSSKPKSRKGFAEWVLCCKHSRAGGHALDTHPDVYHFNCERYERRLVLPSRLTVATVTLKPTLTMVNTLPFGTMTVAWRADSHQAPWHEVVVPSRKAVNLYDVPTGTLSNGIFIRSRLGDTGPWSAPFHYAVDMLQEIGSSQTFDIRQSSAGAAASLVVETSSRFQLRFSCPFWFVHRVGLFGEEELAFEVQRRGAPLPYGNGITLLPSDCHEKACDLFLKMSDGQCSSHSVRMPPIFSTFAWKTPLGKLALCVQAEDTSREDVSGAKCQILTLRPRLVLTNATNDNLELCLLEGSIVKLAAGESHEQHWPFNSVQRARDTLAMKLQFRPVQPSRVSGWSSTVVCDDSVAGTTSYLLRGDNGEACNTVWSVEVAPSRGALGVSFKQASDFIAVNKTKAANLNMLIHPRNDEQPTEEHVAEIVVYPDGKEVPLGWTQPSAASRSVDIVVDGVVHHVADIRRSMRRVLQEARVVIVISRVGERTLVALEDHQHGDQRGDARTSHVQVELNLIDVGVSLVQEMPEARELLFLDLADISAIYCFDLDEDTEHVGLTIADVQVSCQLPNRMDGKQTGCRESVQPAVIVANRADDDAYFIKFSMQREAASSRDLLLKCVELSLDKLDVTADDGWLDPLLLWVKDACPETIADGVRVHSILDNAGCAISKDYIPPLVSAIVQTDVVRLSDVQLTLWTSLRLSSLDFLPKYARAAIQIFSLGNTFTLSEAKLALPGKELAPQRGSLDDLMLGISSEYALALLSNTANLLGHSSLLNLPMAPILLPIKGTGYVGSNVAWAIGEGASKFGKGASKLSQFTGSRRMKHGVDGLKGFMSGVGQGVAGNISNIAAWAESGAKKRRNNRERQRQPRLLFNDHGEIHLWSEIEAELLRKLGWSYVTGVRTVVTVAQEGQQVVVFMIFESRVVLCGMTVPLLLPKARGNKSICSVCQQHNHHDLVDRCFHDTFYREDLEDIVRPSAVMLRALDYKSVRSVYSESSDSGDSCLLFEELCGRKHAVPLYGHQSRHAVCELLEEILQFALVHPSHSVMPRADDLQSALRLERQKQRHG